MVECDIIVYDITDDSEQIDESVWAVSGSKYAFNINITLNFNSYKISSMSTFNI